MGCNDALGAKPEVSSKADRPLALKQHWLLTTVKVTLAGQLEE